jgi:hypothetical protein
MDFLSNLEAFLTQSIHSVRLFLQSSELGPPPPLTRRRVCTPLWFRRGVIPDCGRGDGGGPNLNEGTDTVVLLVYMYFVISQQDCYTRYT